jgi:formylglycine-generating enzyme required for sulfatase activity
LSQHRVKTIAWLLSLIITILIVMARCQRQLPVSPLAGNLSISGKVTLSGATATGVEVQLSGEKSAAATPDSLGNYEFKGLSGGLYRVAPLRQGYNFSPPAYNLQLTERSLADQNFTMLPVAASILALRTSLDFGSIFIGSSKQITLGLTNLGQAALSVTQLAFSNGVFSSTVKSLNLPPDSLTFLPVNFSPTAAGQFTAQLTLTTNDPKSPKITIDLTGAAVIRGAPRIDVQPTELNFGPVKVGASGTARLTLNNTGTDTLHISSIAASDSAYKPSAVNAVLPAGRSLELIVTYTPRDTSKAGATLAFVSDAVNQPRLTVNLSGSGTTGQPTSIRVSAATLDFGRVFLDSVKVLTINVSNTGRDSLLVTAFQFGDDQFSTPFRGEILAPGQARTYPVVLTARRAGRVQTELGIYSSDPNQTRTVVTLTANITPLPPTDMRINPSSLAFGQVTVGKQGLKWFYLVNPTDIPLVAWRISASSPSYTARIDSLTVAPNDSFRVEVEFAPLKPGALAATLTMRTNVLNRDTVQVPLTGEGVAPPNPGMQLDVTALDFGSVVLGNSRTAAVSVSNKGPGDLIIAGLETDNGNFLVQTFNASLPAGSVRNIEVIFQPQALGLVRGSLYIHTNDPVLSNALVSLTGAAIDTTGHTALMNLSTHALDLGRSLVQLSSSGTLEVGNLGKDTLDVLSIRSSRAEFSATPSLFSVLPGTSREVIVTFSPLVPGQITGLLVILSNDQLRPQDSVAVTGTGLSPDSSTVTAQEVFIPGGVFSMGQAGEAEPVRRVTLNSFYMDTYEVTNAEFKAFMDAGGYNRKELWTTEGWDWRNNSREQSFNPSDPRPMFWGTGQSPWESDPYSNASDTPVVGINWYEAYAYARFRGKSLPTEAQWEYAARGIFGRVYPWGDLWQDNLSNHGKSRSPYYDETDGYRYAAPAGAFPAGKSPEGVLNLAGNVWEWCLDWYAAYDQSETFNPQGPATGTEKVVRGGSWTGSILFCRGFHRNPSEPQLRYKDGGIRLVRNF